MSTKPIEVDEQEAPPNNDCAQNIETSPRPPSEPEHHSGSEASKLVLLASNFTSFRPF